MLYLQENFWQNVQEVWKKFRGHMENDEDDIIIATLCGGDDDEDGEAGKLDAKTKAACELTLKALSFKHKIPFSMTTKTSWARDNSEDSAVLYMRCILVNIFMKRIIGKNCLEKGGGQLAFTAAQAFVRQHGAAEYNFTCEQEDAAQGGDRRQQPGERDLWDIMDRWFTRNTLVLRDGEQGVLGQDCNVRKTRKGQVYGEHTVTELKNTVKEEIREMEQELEEAVQNILTKVKEAGGEDKSMDDILKEVKSGDSSSTSSPRDVPDARPPPPHPPRRPSTPRQSPGRTASPYPGKVGSGTGPETTPRPRPRPKPTNSAPSSPSPTPTPGNAAGHDGQAAKPVAAKPVAPKPVAKKPRELQDCQGDKLLEWRQKEIYVAQQYSEEQWKKVKKVLDEFKNYMQQGQQHMDAYGANCYNVGWDDLKEDGNYFIDQQVADVVRCRLMSVALWFANQNGIDGNEDTEVEKLRCEVANTFGHMLKKMYCPQQGTWDRGIEYAGITFKRMQSPGKDGQGALQGPVMDGKCNMCGYVGHKQNVEAVNLDIAHWLRGEGKMLDGIQHIDGSVPCTTKWAEYTKDKAKKHKVKRVDDTKIPKIKQDVEKIRTEAVKTIEKVIKVVQEKIKAVDGKATNSTMRIRPGPTAHEYACAHHNNTHTRGNSTPT
ncbi:hypothetical protein AK88_05605 [Plasmodium fragile]|uniref:Schizont-infected cell agglutination extracellular alpha domain-containing protein n=1 Tax=Plasmodium fragile TaxID=5857 RepID=A0A0D9QCN0_PLAFR|nr:uncharacterized protein AK88_05605 [Plasmodium fragile]KJP84763.1 hypothetical protein AK88_05605 [Plasmodium fragile]